MSKSLRALADPNEWLYKGVEALKAVLADPQSNRKYGELIKFGKRHGFDLQAYTDQYREDAVGIYRNSLVTMFDQWNEALQAVQSVQAGGDPEEANTKLQSLMMSMGGTGGAQTILEMGLMSSPYLNPHCPPEFKWGENAKRRVAALLKALLPERHQHEAFNFAEPQKLLITRDQFGELEAVASKKMRTSLTSALESLEGGTKALSYEKDPTVIEAEVVDEPRRVSSGGGIGGLIRRILGGGSGKTSSRRQLPWRGDDKGSGHEGRS